MYDAPKVIIGIIIFLAIFLFPFYYNLVWTGPPPELQQPKDISGLPAEKTKACVEATDYMRSSHMELLDFWRDQVVRNKQRMYTSATTGKQYVMSLQNTCMDCHRSKEKFCDRCHDYLNESPKCWECHVAPELKLEKVALRSN
jgi:hypothetical protein